MRVTITIDTEDGTEAQIAHLITLISATCEIESNEVAPEAGLKVHIEAHDSDTGKAMG